MNDSALLPAADGAGAVRAGEELDGAAITQWLLPHLPGLAGAPRITQYSGGASNWTYRLEYPEHDLILRRPPAGTKARSAHDMGREFRVQQALKPVYPCVPEMIALCQDESVLGCEFYVMRRVAGLIPRARMPRGLQLDPAQSRALCHAFLDKLVELHQVDYQAAGLAELGKGAGYVGRQVSGWSQRYLKAKTWNVPSFRRVRDWLAANQPDDVATCVIHNDWRLDNVILDQQQPTRIIGVLDWEMATLGDPLMELGSALAYWIQADDGKLMQMTKRQPSDLPGMPSRDEVVAYYLGKMGYQIDNWVFYEVFGLFRLAVIAQQIYFRYHHKQTRNPAFRNFWIMVNYFDWRCRRLIRESGI